MSNPLLDIGYALQDIRYAKDDRIFSVSFVDKDTRLPIDLTSYTFTSGIISPAISFTVSNTAPTTGIITITISASSTSALVVNGKYIWYLKYVVSGKTKIILEGNFFIV